jgi:hypothetical protein
MSPPRRQNPRRQTPSPPDQRRWSWWEQTRDALAFVLGTAIAIIESVRGTYHPVAMGVAATFVLGAAAGVGVRRILSGNGNSK